MTGKEFVLLWIVAVTIAGFIVGVVFGMQALFPGVTGGLLGLGLSLGAVAVAMWCVVRESL